MTQQEYNDYVKAVEQFFEHEGITTLACVENCSEMFLSSPCDCCKRDTGGGHQATGYNPQTKEVYDYNVCDDCVYFATYERLDDMTMLRLSDANT